MREQDVLSQPPQDPDPDSTRLLGNAVSVLDLMVMLAKHKRVLIGFPLAVAIITVVVVLLLPNIYTGSARLLPPPQSPSPVGAAIAQLAGGDLTSGSMFSTTAAMYVGILKSRTIADKLIAQFDLKKVYRVDTLLEARKELENKSKIEVTDEGLIAVDVDDKEPKRAAAMANAYLDELERLTQQLSLTEAGQRRIFLEKQLKMVRDQLTDAELAMKKVQEKTGVLALEDQARVIIEAIAAVKAQIAGKEVQIETMRTFATAQNPDMKRVQQEIGAMRSELKRLETGELVGGGSVFVPTGKVPEVGLEYLRQLRNVKYYETLFQIVAKQYELARADEARDTPKVQAVDRAVEPDKKSKPYRALITAIAVLVAGFLAVLWILFREGLERAGRDPDQATRLMALRRHLAFRRCRDVDTVLP